jgi:single-strand DNA-binding protein
MGINKVILVGNVGRDPEVKALPSGTTLTKFSLATTEPRSKDPDGNPHTEWHNIVVWGRLAEICGQYVRKGRQLYIEGRIRRREYERDGQKMYFTEVHADNFELLGRRDDFDQGGYGGGGYGGGGPSGGGYGGGGPSGGGYDPGGPSGGGGPSEPAGPSFPDDSDDVPF